MAPPSQDNATQILVNLENLPTFKGATMTGDGYTLPGGKLASWKMYIQKT